MLNICKCGKEISRQSKSCKSCSNRSRPKNDTLKKDIERFVSKIIKLNSGCHVLKGQENSKGYSYVSIRQKQHGAHRVSLFVFKGLPLDTPMDAMHSCDNPKCVNPDHLSYGTRTDNMQDASLKGRVRNTSDWRGTKNPKSKIDPSCYVHITKLVEAGTPRKDIAAKYRISTQRVSQILGSK